MTSTLDLIKELVTLPGPPGQEDAVRNALVSKLPDSIRHETDAKGNLLVRFGENPKIVVTAHLDEIALMVSQIEEDGVIRVTPLGGTHPWKWGEGPVHILTRSEPVTGIVSFGSIHSDSTESVAQHAREHPLKWDKAQVWTGLNSRQLQSHGVRPGCRVVLAPERRTVTQMRHHIASYFLDDRAPLTVWVQTIEQCVRAKDSRPNVLFAATTSEEVGGDGAAYLLQQIRPPICIALEIGPKTPESPFAIDDQPTIWVKDGYAACDAADLHLLETLCAKLNLQPHWQALSRGGSDATTAASRGVTARPITIAVPVENSHGYEIMHRDAPERLQQLLWELIVALQ